MAAVTGIAFWSAINEGNNILYGLPGWTTPLFLFPALIIVLTLGMLVGTIGSWWDRGWGIPGRLYYAFVTLLSLVFLGALVPLGWLWVWA